MNLSFYKNTSDAEVVAKNLEFVSSITVNQQIAKPLLDMTITIPKSEIAFDEVINYCNISELNRNYFIRDISKNPSGTLTLTLHQDVLSSHFDKIKGIDAWILRQEHKANLYVDDEEIIVQNRSDQVVLKFPNTFGVDSNGAPVGTNVMLVLGSAQIIKEE